MDLKDIVMSDLVTQIDTLIAQTMKAEQAPGIAVGVTRNGKTLYLRGHGVMNVDTGNPATAETLFHMASVTKLFVCTSLVQLAERGRLDLDAPVVTYLPYFRLDDPRYRQITVAQMLAHTSGMPDTDDYGWERPEFDEGALERYVRSLGDLKLLSEPGERFAYSNIAFEVLGDVIAKVSGVSFEEYVRREILEPLGMRRSTLLVREADPELLASPHVPDASGQVVVSEVFPYNRAHAPSSTLYSNAAELSRFALAHLNRGSLDGTSILATEAYDRLWRPVAPSGVTYWQQIGLGWFVRDRRGRRLVGHSGADVGFRSILVLAPDDATSLVAMGNLDQMKLEALTDAIIDAVLAG